MEGSEFWMLNSWYPNDQVFGQYTDRENGEMTFIPSGRTFNRARSSDTLSFTDAKRTRTPSLLAKTAKVTDCLTEFLRQRQC
jgi:hypothetical protein